MGSQGGTRDGNGLCLPRASVGRMKNIAEERPTCTAELVIRSSDFGERCCRGSS